MNNARRARPAVLRSGPETQSAAPGQPGVRQGNDCAPAPAGPPGYVADPGPVPDWRHGTGAGRSMAGLQLHARPLGGTTGRLAFRRVGRPARRPGYGE